MRDVFVVGAGQTPVTKTPGSSLRGLGVSAMLAALEDAGVPGSSIDALYVGNMASGILSSQVQVGSLIADYAGIAGIEAVTVESACASGGAAVRMAFQAIAGGMHDLVAVCGIELLSHVGRDTATRALATATDWELEGSRDESFISINAALMQAYIDRYGTRADAFAPFSITAHKNALHNANALFHKPIDVECYMQSRVVHEPLRLYDISPICDGAATVILASAEVAKGLRDAGAPAVRIAASSMATAAPALERRKNPLYLEAVEIATRQALSDAALDLGDIDFLELHDAYTIMTVLSLEASGFAKPGQGCEIGVSGRIALTGDLPIATFGGLKARGHPVGATGVYQIVEAYLQLTERAGKNQVRGAELGLVQNIGGTASAVVSHILQRQS